LTIFNVRKITQGWADSPLIPQGMETARKVAEYLKDKNISLIYSSDLGRCLETSSIVNEKLKVKIIQTAELREQNYGVFNGVPKEEIRKIMKDDDFDFKPEKGESFLEMNERILKFVNEKLPKTKGKALVVTHDGCFQSILSEALQTDLKSDSCKTSPLTICSFEFDGKRLKLLERVDLT
jgi:broad specificity phosphatase PhoE